MSRDAADVPLESDDVDGRLRAEIKATNETNARAGRINGAAGGGEPGPEETEFRAVRPTMTSPA